MLSHKLVLQSNIYINILQCYLSSCCFIACSSPGIIRLTWVKIISAISCVQCALCHLPPFWRLGDLIGRSSAYFLIDQFAGFRITFSSLKYTVLKLSLTQIPLTTCSAKISSNLTGFSSPYRETPRGLMANKTFLSQTAVVALTQIGFFFSLRKLVTQLASISKNTGRLHPH